MVNENYLKKIKNYSNILKKSKNIILRGAPGTGKSYMAKDIAANIINEEFKEYSKLSPVEKERIEFVQFHPNYDYTDFVEGLRPKLDKNGGMFFELKSGIFYDFIKKVIESEKTVIELVEELKDEELTYDEIKETNENIEKYKEIIEKIESKKVTVISKNSNNSKK